MNKIANFAINMLQRNPQFANNPQAQKLMEIIQNGDSQQGEKMAENLCETYGMTKDQALTEAKKFFGIK